MNKKTQGLIELNIATFIMGGNATLAQLISLSAPLTILFRSIFAVGSLFMYLVLGKGSLKFGARKNYFWAIFLGMLMGLHWMTFFQSSKVSTAAISLIALFTYPVMTAFIEPVFFKEKLKGIDVVLALAVLGGVVLIVPEFTWGNSATQGVAWGLVAALLLAFRNVLTKQKLSKESGSGVMFYQLIGVFLVSLPFLLSGDVVFVGYDLWYLILLGVVFTALAHTMYINSLQHLSAKTVGIVASLNAIYGILIAMVVLHEIPHVKTLIGGVIILGAVVVETVKARR